MTQALYLVTTKRGEGLMTFSNEQASKFAAANRGKMFEFRTWAHMKFIMGTNLSYEQIETLYNERSVIFDCSSTGFHEYF